MVTCPDGGGSHDGACMTQYFVVAASAIAKDSFARTAAPRMVHRDAGAGIGKAILFPSSRDLHVTSRFSPRWVGGASVGGNVSLPSAAEISTSGCSSRHAS